MISVSGLGQLAVVAIIIFAIPVGMVVLIRRWIARRGNHGAWEPVIDPNQDLHVLGSDLPQKGGSFFADMVQRRYTVPKDPQAYAQFFVPDDALTEQK